MLVDFCDVIIVCFLHVFFIALVVVLGEAVLFSCFEQVERIAAGLANTNTAIFGHVAGGLREFLAALASEFRDGYPEDASIDHWVKPEIGFLDTFFDIADDALIPRLHHDCFRIWGGYSSDFFKGDCATISGHTD